uniref:Uncharacterized protein n=1 Tax=Rhizophora mucronata TaxID=61149 RepID=A0A2P2PB51_RHIMU
MFVLTAHILELFSMIHRTTEYRATQKIRVSH